MPVPSPAQRLAPFLERLAVRYHRVELLDTDPLALVRPFRDSCDREIAALFAALLSYGNVKQIRASVRDLFARMGGHPGRFVEHLDLSAAARQLAGFKHRFTDSDDILCLCHLLNQAMRGGSLEDAFLAGCRDDEPDLAPAAGRFVALLHAGDFAPAFRRARMMNRKSFRHLLPRPEGGSACKRIHLFLRWVVRPDDGLDLGLWRRVDAAKLLVPVDTHILRVAQNLGITGRKTHSLAAAREITAALRHTRPHDPAGLDFALCRLGILQACPTASQLDSCRACELHDPCARRKRLESVAARRTKR